MSERCPRTIEEERIMKKLILVLLIISISGCWGYLAKDNELIGQVKKVEKNTPLICPDYVSADITLGVMKNGTGSLSKEDVWVVVADKDQEKILRQANETGQLVKIKYDQKRCGGNYFFCTYDMFVREVEIIK
jgi:hypothetical protein